MKVEVLISTMNEIDNNDLVKKMNIKTPSVTINQLTQENLPIIIQENTENKIYSYKEVGLSKSRNKAIIKSTGNICIIADNDVKYVDNYEQIILKEYMKNPHYDIIIFNVENNSRIRRKRKIKNDKKLNSISVMKIVSPQITFRKESIKSIKFDENFGAGTYFDRGEETIWLRDCLRNNRKIKYINKTIATIDEKQSTWFKGYDKEFLEKQGSVFFRLFPKLYPVIIFQYAIRKYNLYKKEATLYEAIKLMMKGKKQYEKIFKSK